MTVQLDVEALVASLSTTATIEYTPCEPCAQDAGEVLSSTATPMLTQYDNTTPDVVETDEPAVVATKDADGDIKWEGILGFEGVLTGDGRFIMPDSLRWETLPLPIRVVFADVGAHDGAQVVGHIQSIERKPIKGVPNAWALWGEGTFDDESDAGKEAIRLVERELSNGISMDLDDVSFEVRVADQIPKADEKEDTAALDVEGLSALPGMSSKVLTKVSPTDEITVTTSGRIRAATLVSIAAFAAAKVHLVESTDGYGGTKEADTTTDAGDGAGVAKGDEGKPRGVLAVDRLDMSSAWSRDSGLRVYAQRRPAGGGEKDLGTPCRLGGFAGSDPSGPDSGSPVPEHHLLQPSTYGTRDGSGEHSACQPGTCFVSPRGVWVWAHVRGGEHRVGETPTQGWFELHGEDVPRLLEQAGVGGLLPQTAGGIVSEGWETQEAENPVAAVVAAGYDIPEHTSLDDALETFAGDGDPSTNWIEETGTGHLPPYIRQFADALLRTGASESHAIATAVNTVKRWAGGGTVRANGGPHVLPDTVSKAAAAIAEWEVKRAQAAANAAETVTLAAESVTVSASDSVPEPQPEYTPEQLEVLARAFRFKAFRDFTPKQREKAAEDGAAMPGGSFPIKNRQDLKNAIQAAGRAKDFEAVKRHIKRRARELDLENLIPDDWATDLIMAV